MSFSGPPFPSLSVKMRKILLLTSYGHSTTSCSEPLTLKRSEQEMAPVWSHIHRASQVALHLRSFSDV